MLILMLCASLTGCDQLKRFIGSGERAIIYCDVGQQVVAQLVEDKLITPEKAAAISEAVARIRAGASVFVERARSYLGRKIDAGIKAELAALLPEIVAGLDQLENAGLIDLKPEVKRKFDTVMAMLKALVRLNESRLNSP